MSRIPIRWRDLDPLGHVNSAVYMTLFEAGRDLWLGELLGPPFTGDQYVIARIEIDFLAEIGREIAHVESRHEVEAVGTASITLREELSDPDGVSVAQARVVIVLWDPRARRARPVSAAERRALIA
ncbi:MAG TPA: thioesterase family protein [Solirubrobacteraceae bacterium]|nr:thioesterase family protein [Solirubrobacteraceae bacterium]